MNGPEYVTWEIMVYFGGYVGSNSFVLNGKSLRFKAGVSDDSE